MSRAAFTDYSGLRDFGRRKVSCRTRFFVHTLAFLDENQHVLDHGFIWNGTLAEVRLDFSQKTRGWEATLDVNLPELMSEPNSGFAEYLLNQTLDVLALRSASSFQCVIQGVLGDSPAEFDEAHTTGAIVTIKDLDQAVRMGMLLYTFEGTLLKALSWYRRGISTVDPVLGFLAIWNSLETVAAKFHKQSEETVGKSKKQIFQLLTDHLLKSGIQFFKPKTEELWNWIEASYGQRKDLAHGLRALSPTSNEQLRKLIPQLKSIVTAILRVMLDLRCKENGMIAEAITQAEQRKQEDAEADAKLDNLKSAVGKEEPA